MIVIYADGAYSSSRNRGGWAFVVIKDDVKIDSCFGDVDDTTNNRMEIQASYEALEWANEHDIKEFTIRTDSMYVIGTMTLNWKKKKNVDLWVQMFESIEGLNVSWEHVKGHNGDKWNDYVDMLAQHASRLELNDV